MGKHLKTVAELIQRGLRKIDTRCKSKGLSENPEKTKVVLLTRRKKTKEVVDLNIKEYS